MMFGGAAQSASRPFSSDRLATRPPAKPPSRIGSNVYARNYRDSDID